MCAISSNKLFIFSILASCRKYCLVNQTLHLFMQMIVCLRENLWYENGRSYLSAQRNSILIIGSKVAEMKTAERRIRLSFTSLKIIWCKSNDFLLMDIVVYRVNDAEVCSFVWNPCMNKPALMKEDEIFMISFVAERK